MPYPPSWFDRLESVCESLRQFPLPVLDRAALQQLFGISKMQACRLLSRWGGFRLGGAWLIGKQELLENLQQIRQGGEYHAEIRRRQRLREELERSRRLLAARQRVAVPASRADSVRQQRLRDLPAEIQWGEGELRVRFQNAEDLLEKLARLAYAFANADPAELPVAGSLGVLEL